MNSPTDNKSNIRRRLGRGLGSLISAPVKIDVPATSPAPPAATGHFTGNAPAIHTPSTARNEAIAAPADAGARSDGLHSLPIAAIRPNVHQPRQHFDQAAIESLASSIRVSGVMQPIVVRPSTAAATGTAYELIAGERRWRAAQVAGLTHIPAVVRDVDDQTAAEFSLVENLQREDLNPIERAQAFERLMREFHLTQAEIAERVGLDRSSISNHLRLLELSGGAMDALRDGRLSMGHAKALLAITNIDTRDRLASQALELGWSVREIERQAREIAVGASGRDEAGDASRKKSGDKSRAGASGGPGGSGGLIPAHLIDLQKRLGEHLGTKVHIHVARGTAKKGAGKLVIEFYSIDQFEGLLRHMNFEMEE